MRPITKIILHCSATSPTWRDGQRTSTKVREIKRWHTDPKPQGRGWSDIGYHLLNDLDGTIAKGRPMWRVGAHVYGHNTGSIGLCLIGGRGASASDKFEDHFTDAQRQSTLKTIAELCVKYPSITSVSGHNDYAAKGCPGFKVISADWMPAAGVCGS